MAATLCLNMIVRNESAILERCLRSVAEHVGCYVIADTGSSDGTQDIVRRFFAERGIPGEIHEYPFENFEQARNTAIERALASPLGFDYLLFTDADMELVVTDKQFRERLVAPAYNVLQRSGLSYWNNRLLHRACPGRYRGLTHEYLHVPDRVDRLEGIWFIDHANGANRREKYERDLRLLNAALADAPDDRRAWYYLAQTYRDMGRHSDAAEAFQRRADLGGWDEEAWHARWQRARSLLRSGDEAGFLREAHLAWNSRPHRAEPLFDLARYWRDRRAHDLACTYAELGLGIAWPERDVLFIDDFIYSCGLASEYSISGFFARQPRHRERGRELCEWLALRRDIPADTRRTAQRNAGYYAAAGVKLLHSLRLAPLTLPAAEGAAVAAPSLALRRGELALLLQVRREAAEPSLLLCALTPELHVRHHSEVAVPSGAGADAPMLLVRGQLLWCLSPPAAPGEAAWLWPLEETQAPLRPPLPDGAGVVASTPLPRFIAGDDPLAFFDETGRVLARRPARFVTAGFVCASPAIAFDGGWLLLVLERGTYNERERVFHRLLWIDADAEPLRLSLRFDLRQPGTERVHGLAWHPDGKRLVLSAQAEDGQVLIGTVTAADVRAALRTFAGEYAPTQSKPSAGTRPAYLANPRRREVVLFRTHEWTPAIEDAFRRIARETRQADVVVCAYVAPQQPRLQLGQTPAYVVGPAEIRRLPYPGKLADFTPARPGGGNDLPVLSFWTEYPGYAHYWVVEYDVYYTGNWGALLTELAESDADLLGTVVQDHDENPGWGWWPTLRPAGPPVPRSKLTRCFPPLVRLSARALTAIDAAYRDGFAGHYEATWATICRLADLNIEEIGGDGRYTPTRRRNRYYTTTPKQWTLFPGTFVYRPSFRPEDVRALGSGYNGADMLWHPVKP